jgi:hypothetical protein
MYVRVNWLRAPRRIGYLHRVGESCLVDADRAKILEEGGWLTILPSEEVKKPVPRKAQTRPMKREKDD